jgi:hypothetical protein
MLFEVSQCLWIFNLQNRRANLGEVFIQTQEIKPYALFSNEFFFVLSCFWILSCSYIFLGLILDLHANNYIRSTCVIYLLTMVLE